MKIIDRKSTDGGYEMRYLVKTKIGIVSVITPDKTDKKKILRYARAEYDKFVKQNRLKS